ncbi:MAG: ribosome silencing factor [Bacteroidales bacterium]|nr:ribosome silencing factor [Bacteroidales bacterium]
MNNTQKLLEAIKEGMIEKMANNIVNINFSGTENAITDFFIICDAENQKQVEAISDSVEKTVLKNTKEKPIHTEGKENAEWIIIDYFDVIVHIFRKEFRETYKLEELWGDAEINKIEVKYSNIEN